MCCAGVAASSLQACKQLEAPSVRPDSPAKHKLLSM